MARLTDQDYNLLSAYLDGNLTEAERSALDARLQAEPDLREEVEALRATVELIRALPPITAPRDYSLDARVFRPARWWIFPATSTFSALSAAAATLLVALGLITLFSASAPKAVPVAAPQVAAQLTMQMTATPALLDGTLADVSSAAGAAAKASPTEETERLAMNDAQEETNAAQRDIAPDAMLPPGALPAPQGSPPSVMMESVMVPTGTVEDFFFGSAADQTAPAERGAELFAAPAALEPTPTTTPTSTPTAAPTITPSPTLTPTPIPAVTTAPANALGSLLLVAGAVLLALALVTTLARRRSR